MRIGAALALACACTLAGAVETTAWPPPAQVEARMHELQAVIASRGSTAEQREAARKELAALLRNPSAHAPTPDENKAPARAAIEPYPRIVKPAEGPVPAAPPVAHLEVVEPPRTLVPIPGSAAAAVPATPNGGFALDPRTGGVLHAVPGGYIDPRTGQFVPR
jgi:hypothetical protein